MRGGNMIDEVKNDINYKVISKIWEPLKMSMMSFPGMKRKGSSYYNGNILINGEDTFLTIRSDPNGLIWIKKFGEKHYPIYITEKKLWIGKNAPMELITILRKIWQNTGR